MGAAERRQRLDEIGFVWDVHTQQWEEGFAALIVYKNREDDCLVPAKHEEGDFKLGIWVTGQRSKKETLTPERRQRLDDIGFVWNIRLPRTTGG